MGVGLAGTGTEQKTGGAQRAERSANGRKNEKMARDRPGRTTACLERAEIVGKRIATAGLFQLNLGAGGLELLL